MVAMSINLADVGRRPVTSGRALSIAAPKTRGATSGGALIRTDPVNIATIAGVASVEVEPGPVLVQFFGGGVTESKALKGVVPNRACTLVEVLEAGFVYEPPVVQAAQAAAARAEAAAQQAEQGGGGSAPLIPDNTREGFFTIPTGSSISEDPARPGVFLIAGV